MQLKLNSLLFVITKSVKVLFFFMYQYRYRIPVTRSGIGLYVSVTQRQGRYTPGLCLQANISIHTSSKVN